MCFFDLNLHKLLCIKDISCFLQLFSFVITKQTCSITLLVFHCPLFFPWIVYSSQRSSNPPTAFVQRQSFWRSYLAGGRWRRSVATGYRTSTTSVVVQVIYYSRFYLLAAQGVDSQFWGSFICTSGISIVQKWPELKYVTLKPQISTEQGFLLHPFFFLPVHWSLKAL